MEREYTAEVLAGFRAAQRLTYACTAEVAQGLREGTTEREAAGLLEVAFAARGVRSFFHRPFAWFGDRATFSPLRTLFGFLPTDRALVEGVPAILDVAPVIDGHTVDIGYSFVLGRDPEPFVRARAVLRELRSHILEGVRAGRSMRSIYESVDAITNAAGFDNCHQKYPFRVLAHKVDTVAAPDLLRNVTAFRFGPAGAQLLARAAAAAIENGDEDARSPLWNTGRQSEVPPEVGLWAVEPHIGRDGIGAKWEEILVVTRTSAFWLDDDVPHARPANPGGT